MSENDIRKFWSSGYRNLSADKLVEIAKSIDLVSLDHQPNVANTLLLAFYKLDQKDVTPEITKIMSFINNSLK